ncbi:MAG TPA: hypothetical protein PK335_05665 [Draconibacterium sp.]|nr:hypothetical protein [Draconibacterium sp.]
MEKVLFSEEQRFNQWWFKLLMVATLLSVLVPFSIGIYSQVVLNKPFGDHPMSTPGLSVTGIASVVMVGFIFLKIFTSSLKTKITEEALFVAYPPFIRKWKKISREEIERYEIRTFRARREYGGHGLKRRRKYGTSYTVSGDTGLQLYFKNGKKLLIGTQKKQALEYAMRKLMEGEE